VKVHKIKTSKGQESVWDYPRPPVVKQFHGHIQIIFADESICESNACFRVLETSHPPVYYLPIEDFKPGVLKANSNKSICEYKGLARYYDIVHKGRIATQAAWRFSMARGAYADIQNCVAVYAQLMDSCHVNGEAVQAQEGDFYGGWITSNIVGPFKGGRGTWGW
jgi:uncharacterized protein (DUF427 family)